MTTTTPKNTKKGDSPLSSPSPASSTPSTGSSGTASTPDTRDLFVQEYEFIVDKTGESTTVQYFCNRENEPVYFPDRTLATLFQVNLSTLRGRFNRMTKKHEGYRLLISEKSKTRLSSLHFINWGSENFVDTNTEGVRGSASPLHGLVALNHIILVNYALAEWIAYNHERLGTSLVEIESNLKKVNLSYTRTNNVINILQKRPSGFTPPISTPSTSSKPSTTSTHPSMTGMYRSTMNTTTSNAMGITTNGDRMVPRRPSEDDLLPLFSPLSSPSTSPTQPHPLINPTINPIHSIPRKRVRDDWCSPLSSVKQPTNDLVPVHSQQTLPSFSAYNFSKYLKLEREPVFPSAPASNNDNHEHNNHDNEHGYDSESGSPRPPSSPKRWPVDNTIQCILEGENVCHRLDLSCLEGFAALKAALSTLFRVNSFNILYQTILDSGYQELGVKDNGDEEKWLQFLAIVKKICVKPFSVTPQLKNLLS